MFNGGIAQATSPEAEYLKNTIKISLNGVDRSCLQSVHLK